MILFFSSSQVFAAAAALAAGHGDGKGPALVQNGQHSDLHMPHGENISELARLGRMWLEKE